MNYGGKASVSNRKGVAVEVLVLLGFEGMLRKSVSWEVEEQIARLT